MRLAFMARIIVDLAHPVGCDAVPRVKLAMMRPVPSKGAQQVLLDLTGEDRYYPAMLLRAASYGFIRPCLPSSAERPPKGTGWVHEIKHDGYRLIVRRDGDRVRLYTRHTPRQGYRLGHG
jgi:ATP-dependent DNA ligase